MTETTLHIDWTRCRARGACIDLVPGLTRDPWGYPILGTSGSCDNPPDAAKRMRLPWLLANRHPPTS